jgi:hypothetical protein
MNDIPRATKLEIFTNPHDLTFTVNQDKESEKFAVGIFRGPDHQREALVTTEPFTRTREKALNVIREILENICNVYESGKGPDVLGQELIKQIIKELRENNTASTWLMLEKKA